jgi:hypothetical protein
VDTSPFLRDEYPDFSESLARNTSIMRVKR